MGSSPSRDSAPPERYYEAVAEYHERLEQGARIDIEQFLTEYQDVAEELREYLDTASQLEKGLSSGEVSANAAAVPGTSRDFADYELFEEIARGGMGVVYRARQVSLNRPVALKMILAGEFASPDAVQRFHREAEAAANLDHAHIVPVYEIGVHQERHYFSMKLMEGGSLAQRRNHFTNQPRAAAELVRTVARAVHFAHLRGVLHRDLKPANILLDQQGQPHVADFGLAKRVASPGCQPGEPGHTRTGAIVGTPSYMAPEQAAGAKDQTIAVDVYALGAILYELLTGGPPFQEKAGWDLIRQVLEVEPVAPHSKNRQVPRDLETICLTCLQKEPARRYASAAELADDLQRFLKGEPIRARPVAIWEWAWKWTKKQPALATLSALVVIVLAGTLGSILWYRHQTAEAAERDRAQFREIERQQGQARASAALADVQRYYFLVSKVRELIANPRVGWKWEGLAAVREAAAVRTPARDPVELRSLAAACLAGVDLRQQDDHLAVGINAFCLAFSPDSRRLAVAESKNALDCRVLIYDPATRELVNRFTVRDAPLDNGKNGVRSLAFSPDGTRLLAGTRLGKIYVWKLQDSRHKATILDDHQGEVTGLAFHPAGKMFVSCAQDKTLKVWHVEDRQPLASHLFAGGASTVAFNPKGDLLAVSGTSSTLKFLDAEHLVSGAKSARILGTLGGAHGHVCFSPSGRFLADVIHHGRFILLQPDAVLGKEGVSDLDHLDSALAYRMFPPGLATGELAAHDGEIYHLEFSPDGAFVVSGGADRQVKLWEVATGRLLAAIPIEGRENVFPVFSPDGHFLAASSDNRVILYEVDRLRGQTMIGFQALAVRAMAVSPDGQMLACLARDHDARIDANRVEFTLWDLSQGRLREARSFEPTAPGDIVLTLAYHLKGAVAYNVHRPVGIGLWDPVRKNHRRALQAEVTALGFARDGQRLWGAVNEQGDDKPGCLASWRWPGLEPASLWSNTLSRRLWGRSGITSVAAGRKWVLAGSTDATTRLFAVADGRQPVKTWRSLGGSVHCVALSPDEKLAVSGTQTGRVQLFRLPDGEPLPELTPTHQNSVEGVSFSPNSQLLATASRDHKVRLWRRTGDSFRELITLPAPGPVIAVAFTPDGTRLFMLVQNERAVRVWHLDRLKDSLAALDLGW